MSTQYQGSTRTRNTIDVEEPSLFDVVLFNDDFTTMDFVVMVLTQIFFLTPDKAEQIMLDVHHKGEGIAGTYTYDIAHSKVARATALARNEGFPLRLKIKKHTD